MKFSKNKTNSIANLKNESLGVTILDQSSFFETSLTSSNNSSDFSQQLLCIKQNLSTFINDLKNGRFIQFYLAQTKTKTLLNKFFNHSYNLISVTDFTRAPGLCTAKPIINLDFAPHVLRSLATLPIIIKVNQKKNSQATLTPQDTTLIIYGDELFQIKHNSLTLLKDIAALADKHDYQSLIKVLKQSFGHNVTRVKLAHILADEQIHEFNKVKFQLTNKQALTIRHANIHENWSQLLQELQNINLAREVTKDLEVVDQPQTIKKTRINTTEKTLYFAEDMQGSSKVDSTFKVATKPKVSLNKKCEVTKIKLGSAASPSFNPKDQQQLLKANKMKPNSNTKVQKYMEVSSDPQKVYLDLAELAEGKIELNLHNLIVLEQTITDFINEDYGEVRNNRKQLILDKLTRLILNKEVLFISRQDVLAKIYLNLKHAFQMRLMKAKYRTAGNQSSMRLSNYQNDKASEFVKILNSKLNS
jgi:hypothetical protein